MERYEDELRVAEKEKADAFTRWIDRPEIKMLISLLPPMDSDIQRDCLDALLRAVFSAGHDAGVGSTARSMLTSIMARRDNERGRR